MTDRITELEEENKRLKTALIRELSGWPRVFEVEKENTKLLAEVALLRDALEDIQVIYKDSDKMASVAINVLRTPNKKAEAIQNVIQSAIEWSNDMSEEALDILENSVNSFKQLEEG